MHIENRKNLQIITEINKIVKASRYKINAIKLSVSLYTSNKQNMKFLVITIVNNILKYEGPREKNLTKDGQDV